MNKIVEMNFGSRLYGTATPTSDVDIKGVYIPDADDILLQRIKKSVSSQRPKSEGEKNFAGEVDSEYYSLDQFLNLVYQGQTVAIDMLFVNDENIIYKTPTWDYLISNRHLLLSKKSEAFIGYCMQQAKKYGIKGSRVAAVRSSLEHLKFLALDGRHHKKLKDFEVTLNMFVHFQNNEFIRIATDDYKNSNNPQMFFEVCGRKIQFNSSLKQGIDILQRLMDEYGKRAILAETNEGVDWKALSHAVRIAQQAIELFETGFVTFPRPNADYLLAIKQGKLPYVKVAEEIENLLPHVIEAAKNSNLPGSINKEFIEFFIKVVYEEEIVMNSLRV